MAISLTSTVHSVLRLVLFDLVDLEDQELRYGRAGIMIHGGGAGNGWPGAWQPRQVLLPTYGCIRMHNEDLKSIYCP